MLQNCVLIYKKNIIDFDKEIDRFINDNKFDVSLTLFENNQHSNYIVDSFKKVVFLKTNYYKMRLDIELILDKTSVLEKEIIHKRSDNSYSIKNTRKEILISLYVKTLEMMYQQINFQKKWLTKLSKVNNTKKNHLIKDSEKLMKAIDCKKEEVFQEKLINKVNLSFLYSHYCVHTNVKNLSEAQWILLGEEHGNSFHQEANARLIQYFYKKGDIIWLENNLSSFSESLEGIPGGAICKSWDNEKKCKKLSEMGCLLAKLLQFIRLLKEKRDNDNDWSSCFLNAMEETENIMNALMQLKNYHMRDFNIFNREVINKFFNNHFTEDQKKDHLTNLFIFFRISPLSCIINQALLEIITETFISRQKTMASHFVKKDKNLNQRNFLIAGSSHLHTAQKLKAGQDRKRDFLYLQDISNSELEVQIIYQNLNNIPYATLIPCLSEEILNPVEKKRRTKLEGCMELSEVISTLDIQISDARKKLFENPKVLKMLKPTQITKCSIFPLITTLFIVLVAGIIFKQLRVIYSPYAQS